jgi:PAS domain S-box-containing protein
MVDRPSSADEAPISARSFDFLAGGGELGALVRAYDWSQTPLGPPQQWPQNLRTCVSTCLHCSFGIVIWWGRDLIMIYNDPYTSILADKHPRALGHKGEECWREVWPQVGPMLERVLDEAKPFTADDLQLMVWRHGYFEECYFCFSYSPVFDENGTVSGVFCPVIETTDKIVGARRLETLRQLAALSRAETVREACQQAIAVLVRNGRDVPFASLSLLSEDGDSVSLTVGTAGSDAHDANVPLAQMPQWPFADALAKPVLLNDVANADLPVGGWSEPPQQVYLAPIILPGSQRARAILVIGLNPHKRLDEPYRSFLELLASQVASTIADTLAYAAERERAEALAELDHAKTVFFSNVSHEFRTPLTLMLGPLEEVLAREPGVAADREAVTTARRNGLRLLKLVNSLLDFSRVEAGRAQASYRATDIAAFTAELASNFRSACERAGLRLVVDCPPLPQPVHLDRDMWEKIVLNLVSNAFKFTFDGEIGVTVRARDGTAELVVRDTGTGIAPAELPRIFERFHRIEHARARTHEGAGIGLALVQELVRLHGGSVVVASTEGSGSSFTVRIPFGTVHLPAGRIDATSTLASTATHAEAFVEEALRWLPDTDDLPEPTSGPAFETRPLPLADAHKAPRPGAAGRPRVLVADDNADMRDYLRRILAPRYDVEAVGDGLSALAAAQARRPDLLLADVMMPGLDGFGLLRAVRAAPALRDLPFVMLSARAGEEARVQGLEAGADDYLVKPFSTRELLARVTASLDMAQLRQRTTETVRQSEAALRQSETRLRALVEGIPQLVWRAGRSGGWVWASPQWTHFTGLTETASAGQGWLSAVHPEERGAVLAAWEAAEASGAFRVEHRLRNTEGDHRWTQSLALPMRNETGEIVEWFGTTTDVQELRRMHEEQLFIIAELQHRSRNLLDVVGAIAEQTLAMSRSPQDFSESFQQRLAALGRVQGLLSREVEPNIPIEQIVRLELAAHGIDDDDDRVHLFGPELMLPTRTIQLLALALHELLTNAIKHGALRTSCCGHLKISWHRDANGNGNRRYRLDWTETGSTVRGHPEATPRGFGRELIEVILPYELDAETRLAFTNDGLRCSIVLPLDGAPGTAGHPAGCEPDLRIPTS